MGTRLSDSDSTATWVNHGAGVGLRSAPGCRIVYILSALAAAQARLEMIPSEAATLIAQHARADLLDLDLVAAETRRTSHSMLGLIRALQQILPESAREYVYVGPTVQDITDTWFALVMRDVGAVGVAGPGSDRGDIAGVESSTRHAYGRNGRTGTLVHRSISASRSRLGRRDPTTHSKGWRRGDLAGGRPAR